MKRVCENCYNHSRTKDCLSFKSNNTCIFWLPDEEPKCPTCKYLGNYMPDPYHNEDCCDVGSLWHIWSGRKCKYFKEDTEDAR